MHQVSVTADFDRLYCITAVPLRESKHFQSGFRGTGCPHDLIMLSIFSSSVMCRRRIRLQSALQRSDVASSQHITPLIEQAKVWILGAIKELAVANIPVRLTDACNVGRIKCPFHNIRSNFVWKNYKRHIGLIINGGRSSPSFCSSSSKSNA